MSIILENTMNTKRRKVLNGIFGTLALSLIPSACKSKEDTELKNREGEYNPHKPEFVQPPDFWTDKVPENAYNVLFHENTERPGTSPLNLEKRDGTFICAACFQPLFLSSQKYDSGTGWPSFFDHLSGSLGTKQDFGLFSVRTEYHCSRCGGHQGHVFDDGPQPTGKRFCNNGLALNFIPFTEQLPKLRG